ncbi:hypothetical protein OAS39_06975 [Pirellulales bacterium]|nr:hypothetical protein [Pirellulales bacterium]
MSDEIVFEDGRVASLASSPLSWVLKDAAEYVSPVFALWVNDIADRPNGLMSFDIRGLAPTYREELFSAIQQAFAIQLSNQEKKLQLHDSRYLQALHRLLLMRKMALRRQENIHGDDKHRVEWDGELINITDLWFCPDCRCSFKSHPCNSCSNCGWRHPRS